MKILRSFFENKDIVVYPFIIAVYTTLFLFVHNITEIYLEDIFLPLLIIPSFSLAVFFSFNWFFKNIHKSGIASALVFLFFFSYGFIFNIDNKNLVLTLIQTSGKLLLISFLVLLLFALFILLRKYPKKIIVFVLFFLMFVVGVLFHFIDKNKLLDFLREFVFTDKFIFTIWITFIFLAVYFSLKIINDPSKITPVLNKISIILLLMLFFQGIYKVSSIENIELDNEIIELKNLTNKPDIYYFIFDAYGGEKALLKNFGYNNTPFLDALRERGFYIAEESFSNYFVTLSSIPSSLNMDYLHNLKKSALSEAVSGRTASILIQNNKVMKVLHNANYKIVHFRSGFYGTHRNLGADFTNFRGSILKTFHRLLLSTTMINFLFNTNELLYSDYVLINFKGLKQMPAIKEPTFAFVHFVSPHVPYVFNKDGEKMPESHWYSAEGYIDQLLFINKKILETVDFILKNSETPPIIILQSDHGHEPQHMKVQIEKIIDRAEIFNAYYFPGKKDKLYSSISPVNSFRVLFNEYFGAELELLPDQTYSNSHLIINNHTVMNFSEEVREELVEGLNGI